MRSRLPSRGRRAFTLIEAAFVTVLIGMGVVGTLQLLAAGTMSNAAAGESAIAIQLAGNIREIAVGLPFFDPQNPSQWTSREASVALYDNLLDFDGQSFQPPLAADRSTLTALGAWSQKVTITPVSDADYALSQPKTGSARTARVSVAVLHSNKTVYTANWIAVAPNPD